MERYFVFVRRLKEILGAVRSDSFHRGSEEVLLLELQKM